MQVQIFTSCYDGFIRLMDAEKEVFDLVYSSDDTIYSLSQRLDDVKCLYFSEGHGVLNIWDERIGKCSTQWNLHGHRINSIDFNSENSNVMATSSSDGTACIWDLRSISADQPKPLKEVSHQRAVQSAYFSPSGSFLATTRYLCCIEPLTLILNILPPVCETFVLVQFILDVSSLQR
jgi:WD40 repeat protein